MKKNMLIFSMTLIFMWNFFSVVAQADSYKKINLRVGQNKQLNSNEKVISYDRNMIELKGKNTICPKKTGKTKVLVKHKNKVKKYIFNINNKKVYKLNLYIEDTYKVRIKERRKIDNDIHYISNKKSVASVNQKGKIRAKKPGRAVIKLYKKKKLFRKYIVHVKQGYTLSFPQNNIEMRVGQRVANAAIKSREFNETIFYESSDPSVVSVGADGTLVAKKVGKVVITAEGIQAKAVCTVNVIDCIYNDSARFIAHRGYPDDQYIENTMDAFKNALNKGFYGIETDIRVTSDGVFVLAHSESIWDCGYRYTDMITDTREKEGCIEKLTYSQLQKLTNSKIVTVAEFLEFMKDKQENLFLEIKTLIAENYPSDSIVSNETGISLSDKKRWYQVKKLLNLIRETGMEDKVTISSFDADYLEKIRELDTNIPMQYTTHKMDIDINYLVSHNFGIDMSLEYANKEQMQLLKQNNIIVCLYCADTKDAILSAIELGATNITTNKCLFIKR